MAPDKVELSIMDGLDFSQAHHGEGQADAYSENFHTLKHQEFFCVTLNLSFLGRKRVLI